MQDSFEFLGTIPDWVNGKLVRNGPGEKHIGKDTYKHLFEGSALLHMVSIQDGDATYTSRFVISNSL